MILKAPFPWFGGKSRAAHLIWPRFGPVKNYVEPFAGSLAVLLARPADEIKTETVNDKYCFLANFWRAIQAEPEAVAKWADNPVNEADLHARHRWMMNPERVAEFAKRMEHDPEFYDVKLAGWWVWGQCCVIGGMFCKASKPPRSIPNLANTGMGVNRQIINENGGGQISRRSWLRKYFSSLSERLREVRVACGDWSRVVKDSVTIRHGVTAILLDPPYSKGTKVYANHADGISTQVADWCLANGNRKELRIALCGYAGEGHERLKRAGWKVAKWKACGGYGNMRKDRSNKNRELERIFFSPHCLPV